MSKDGGICGLTAMKNEITIETVLQLVPAVIKKSGKKESVVQCPFNREETFDLRLETGDFKCWHQCSTCPVDGKGKAVNFYRLFNPNLSFKEAVKAIEEQTSVCVAPKPVPKAYKAKPVVKKAPADVADKVLRAFLGLLELSEDHRNDLLRRGLTDEEIDRIGFKSVPVSGMYSIAENLKASEVPLIGVPPCGKDKNGNVLIHLPKGEDGKPFDGYYIPYRDIDGYITQLQIRRMAPSKQGKYLWASSVSLQEGTQASNIAYWGNFDKKNDVVFVTEGGLKAEIAGTLNKRHNVIAIPGVSCYTQFREICAWCKKNGKKMIDAFDMDGKILPSEHIIDKADANPEVAKHARKANQIIVKGTGGERVVNMSVVNALKKLHEISAEEGVSFETSVWDTRYKGIDDFFLAKIKGDTEQILAVIKNTETNLTKKPKNLTKPKPSNPTNSKKEKPSIVDDEKGHMLKKKEWEIPISFFSDIREFGKG